MKCNFIAVLDDSQNVPYLLKKQIQAAVPKLNIPIYTFEESAPLTSFLLDKKMEWGIILLDIVLGKENGINLAIQLKQQSSFWKIIFITGYTRYLSEIFRAEPDGLLFKPINISHMRDSINSLLMKIENEDNNCISINVIKGGIARINIASIRYIESEQRILHIHAKEKSYDIYAKMDDLISHLPDNFIICHKSYLINLYDVESFRDNQIIMSDGTVIPVSRARRKDIRDSFFRYLMPTIQS